MIELGTNGNNSANYCLVYNYYAGAGNPTGCTNAPAQATSGNSGNVAGFWYQDNVNPSFSHTEAYGYDGVNRLTSAAATGNSLYNLAYSYDRYGNPNCVLNGNTNGPCAQFAYNAANQITGYGYDAAGNTTYDGTYTYTWDAEGRLSTSSQGVTLEHTYTYNALGQRAEDIPDTQTGNTQEWFYDPSGQVLGNFFAFPPQPAWWHITVPALGRIFEDTEDWYVGAAWIYHYNALGSALAATRQDGTEVQDTQFYPWGWGWLNQGGWSTWSTGIYAGLISFQCQFAPCMDQSQTRDYSGYRWLSPDALGGSITNPQSLNRYAYALNNPTTLVDPLGLDGYASGPPCGGPGQISCQQYFQVTGSGLGWCPPEFDQCYATLGGATIGVEGSIAFAFLQNVPLNTVGQPCNAQVIADNECAGGVGTVVVGVGTVQQNPNQPPTFIVSPPAPSGPQTQIKGPTYSKKNSDYRACAATGVIGALVGSESGPGLLMVNLAFLWKRIPSGPAIAVAYVIDLAVAVKIRETCIAQTFGPGYF